MSASAPLSTDDRATLPHRERTIALVGLMGVGKSTVGRRLAQRLSLPFHDGDDAIERAAAMSVSDIFARLGETEFRAGEARVMRRLLEGPRIVLATGGGAMLDTGTQAALRARATTVWLKADLEVMAERVGRRDTRPLLRGRDAKATLAALAQARYPIYAQADVTIETGQGPHTLAVQSIVTALQSLWAQEDGR